MGNEKISAAAEEVIKNWLKDPYDEATREEVKRMVKENPEEANDAFSTELKFGTGGLRAKMGPGPGRMNNYTIQIVTQGLANYIKSFPKEKWANGVVICHDCRIHSRDFAEEAAKVLAGNEIPVHLVVDLRPTPFCSFCVRHYQAIAGINITASHNPKEYNGYKVYWDDGAQVVPPHDQGIIDEVEKINKIEEVNLASIESNLISMIDRNAEEAYYKALFDLSLFPDRDRSEGADLKIIYTPLNGAGVTMIPEALKRAGFTDIHLVEEQAKPDGSFPTIPYPNPETDDALKLGWRDLKEKKGDIFIASDPDSDRLSCSILVNGTPKRLTGNEVGAIFLHNLIHYLKPKGRWASVTTIVSSPLISEMTEKNGGTCFEVLTGFKYIGELIHQWEEAKDGYDFLFGMEESLGYLYGTHTRDKDATIAALITAECALSLKKKGATLLDELHMIYQAYGVFREGQRVIKSEKGMEPMLKQMAALRQEMPRELLGIEVEEIQDYQTQKSLNVKSGETTPLTLPKSNVLLFKLKDKSRFIVRPSGTEPMLKIYGQIWAPSKGMIEDEIKEQDARLEKMLSQIEKEYF